MTTPRIRVLVVDDSAFARKVVREMLAGDRIEVVGSARDGEEALALTAELAPDLVISDLVMPRLDGVGFVRRQMALRPVPILILSSAAQDAAEVFDALNAGAVDFIGKPSALATEDLRKIREQLLEKVGMCLRIPLENLLPPQPARPAAVPPPAAVRRPGQPRFAIVVIGISTGGPQALRRLLPLFPRDFPVPIGIVLHMPVGYTALYAQKLDELCALDVKEAAEGDVLRPGLVLLAQAGRHLAFARNAQGDAVARLTVQPLDKLHRPSADVMFQSAAEIFGDRTLGVVMTGMGDDGTQGSAWIKAQGGVVLTEEEKSCVIYGMPRSVVEAGLSDAAVPLDRLAESIISRL